MWKAISLASDTMMSDTALNGPVKTHLKSPSPPRWRFVNEAKKSYGYSSASAGHVVYGFTSEELAAKYNPPEELDAQRTKKIIEREVQVGRIDTTNLEFTRKQRKYDDVEVEHDATSNSEMGVTEIATMPTETSEEDANPEDVFIDVPLNDDVPESDEVVVAVPKDPITGNSNKRGILLLVVILVAAISISIAVGISFREKGKNTESTERLFSDGLFIANKTSSPSEAPSLASLLPSNSPSEFQLLSNNAPSSSSITPSPRGSSSTPSTFPTYKFRTDNLATPSLEPSATLTTELPSSSPLVIQQIASFTFQGIGFCIDALGYRYDSYYNVGSSTTAVCASLCIKNEAFRGIVIEDDYRCRCLYEDELLILVPGKYDGYGITIGGVGEVSAADGSSNAKCYKYVG